MGRAFVHYLIEPSKLSIEEGAGVYRTNLEINGIVSTAAERIVYQFDRTIPVEFGRDEFLKIKDRPFSFQDTFPLIEGDYKLNLLWKNTLSKEFTSVEATLKVPPARTLTMSSPLLANRVIRNADFLGKVKPFTTDDLQLVLSPRNDFSTKDTMSIFLQLGGLSPELQKSGSLAFVITREGQPFRSFNRALADIKDPSRVLEDVALADFPPAYYFVTVSLLDAGQTELLSGKAQFFVSPNADIPWPWLMYAPLPPAGDPYFDDVLGVQHLRSQDLVQARALLERAHRARPDSPEFALDFCRVLFAAKDYDRLKSVALPFYQNQKRYEFAQYLGETAQALGEYTQAITYYKDFLASFGTNLNVLNAIGDCYLKIGDVAQAVTAWKKSLELNPKQPDIQKKVDEHAGRQKEG